MTDEDIERILRHTLPPVSHVTNEDILFQPWWDMGKGHAIPDYMAKDFNNPFEFYKYFLSKNNKRFLYYLSRTFIKKFSFNKAKRYGRKWSEEGWRKLIDYCDYIKNSLSLKKYNITVKERNEIFEKIMEDNGYFLP